MDAALAKMLDLQFFHQNGWHRRQCPTCKEPFWTLDDERTLCGDSTCVEYDFIGNPLTDKPLSIPEMREAFLSYWEGLGHTRVPRNPVVARWRDDIYLNIASIANYQPHVTSGEVAPPANPLVVSQPCIRLNDLANIGRSGRHFACFEMMGHHSFNSDKLGQHYWTEECVENGHKFLTDVLGLDGTRITYKESTWNGGGNAGPCVEVFAGGLEVATLVFMCLEERDGGEFQIKGESYGMMDLRIIDTGWGLERLAWASTGTPTAYDTVFPETLEMLRGHATVDIATDARAQQLVAEHARVQGVLNLDIGTSLAGLREEVVARLASAGIKTDAAELERVMDPIEAMYALADHLRCLSFMVGDGIVPGNVKAGYLMRLVFRRAFRFQEKLGISTPLSELLAWNLDRMVEDFPEFAPARARAVEMADLEYERFVQSRDRGLRLVERMLQKTKALTTEDLVELYDTHGLGPNTVAEAAAKLGVTVEVPDTFDALIAERHSKEKKVKAKAIVPADVPITKRLFYTGGQWDETFSGTVTWTGKVDGKPACTLNQTCFFHETGGQPADTGTLAVGKTVVQVIDAKKDGDHVVHILDKAVKVGDPVAGVVNWERRMDHARSHTATHIMNQTVRRVLGAHSWQAGTQKYQDCARVDMSHYRRPSVSELHTIEALANAVVMAGAPVEAIWTTRDEAERTWGLSLLQGGIPKGRDVRVVRIGPMPAIDGHGVHVEEGSDYDVEYCGGTHCQTTAHVGPIKLTKTERVQDGVERFEYSAGLHAVSKWQTDEATLRDAADAFGVGPQDVPQSAKRFFDEWKERGKLLDELRAQLAELKAQTAEAVEVGGVRIVVQADLEAGALQQTAANIIGEGKTIALLAAPGAAARLLFARSADVSVDMGAVLREAAAVMGGKGGGRPDFAQGAGPNGAKLPAAMDAAVAAVKAAL